MEGSDLVRDQLMDASAKPPIYANLYVQVLAGIAVGILFGFVSPEQAAAMKPKQTKYLKLIKPEKIYQSRLTQTTYLMVYMQSTHRTRRFHLTPQVRPRY